MKSVIADEPQIPGAALRGTEEVRFRYDKERENQAEYL